jgi:hypothetical protein
LIALDRMPPCCDLGAADFARDYVAFEPPLCSIKSSVGIELALAACGAKQKLRF